MDEEWKGVVSDIKFLYPLSHIVTSGTMAPVHVQKCLALFALAGGTELAKPHLVTRFHGQTFLRLGENLTTIWIDVPSVYKETRYHMLHKLRIPHLHGIDRPIPSLGSVKGQPRFAIKLHLQEDAKGKLADLAYQMAPQVLGRIRSSGGSAGQHGGTKRQTGEGQLSGDGH